MQAGVQTRCSPRRASTRARCGPTSVRCRRRTRRDLGRPLEADRTDRPATTSDGTLEKVRTDSGRTASLYRVKVLTQSYWTYEGVTSQHVLGVLALVLLQDRLPPEGTRDHPGSPYNACVCGRLRRCGGPGEAGSFTFKPTPKSNDTRPGYHRLPLVPAPPRRPPQRSLSPNGDRRHRQRCDAVCSGHRRCSPWRPRMSANGTAQPRTSRSRWHRPDGAVGRWHFERPQPTRVTDGDQRSHKLAPAGRHGRNAGRFRDAAATDDYSLRLNDDVTDPAAAAPASARPRRRPRSTPPTRSPSRPG